MEVRVLNLEAGMPPVEIAKNRLHEELRTARLRGTKVMKIIHGYGSSGTGGKIRVAVQSLLAQKKREGLIREYVPGGDFSPFSEAARRIIASEPALTKDRDYSRGNDGITIVLL